MEETHITRAIILRNRPYKERDSQLELYSREFGRISLIARGTKDKKSKFAGHVEPLTLADVMIIRGRKIDYLGAVVPADSYLKLKGDLDKTLAATQAAKVFLDQVKPGEADEDLFLLLKEFLETMDGYRIGNPELFLHFFMLKFMSLLGFAPELYHSLEDNEKIESGKHFFDFARGGLVGRKISSNCLTISEDCIKIMRLILSLDFKELKKIKASESLAREIVSIVSHFYRYNLG